MSGFNDFMSKAGAFASKAADKAKDLASVAAVKTKDLASVAADKTKKATRVAKLNMDISGQKDTIKKAYTELGRLYYEAHKGAPEEELAPVCQQIDAANAAIAAMEEEIAQLKAAMEEDEPNSDADFETVVQQTEKAAEADVDVEITVETPAEPAEPEVPAEPAEPEAPAEPAEPEAPHEEPPAGA